MKRSKEGKTTNSAIIKLKKDLKQFLLGILIVAIFVALVLIAPILVFDAWIISIILVVLWASKDIGDNSSLIEDFKKMNAIVLALFVLFVITTTTYIEYKYLLRMVEYFQTGENPPLLWGTIVNAFR